MWTDWLFALCPLHLKWLLPMHAEIKCIILMYDHGNSIQFSLCDVSIMLDKT